MDWYEDEVRALEQVSAVTGAVVFYGSSSFRLWDTLSADLASWPLVNRAFGGSTLAACVHFFERLVLPCAPRSLICYAGDNDLGDGRSSSQVVAELQALLAKVDASLGAIPLAVLSIKPSPARRHLRQAIVEANLGFHHTLARRAHSYYVDVYGPMLTRDGEPCRALFADDGLHLSPDGYKLWADILATYRLPLL